MTTLDMTSPEVQAAFAEMAERQRRFDATRPPCPDHWCEGECETVANFGDAVLHVSEPSIVPTSPDRVDETGLVEIRAYRHDSLSEPSSSTVAIDLNQAGSLLGDCVHFEPAQVRLLLAELERHADMIDPEPKVPARAVRVGDFLPVDGEWLYVYCVDVDEPSNCVQVFTTVDRDTLPELDDDEDPHEFETDELVQVRRGVVR